MECNGSYLNVLIAFGWLGFEDVFANQRHNAFVLRKADHRVGFARARLTVGEQRGIVAIPGVMQYSDAQIIVDFFL